MINEIENPVIFNCLNRQDWKNGSNADNSSKLNHKDRFHSFDHIKSHCDLV